MACKQSFRKTTYERQSLKPFRKSKLTMDNELYKKAKYDASKLITKSKLFLKRSFQKQLANLKNYGILQVSKYAKQDSNF